MTKVKSINFLLVLFSFLLGSFHSESQILEPVKWSYSANKISEEEALIVIKAKIDDGWHLYSQNVEEDGPLPTVIAFKPHDGYELIGTPEEKGRAIDKFEEMFDMNVRYFERKVTFLQKIKLKKGSISLEGDINYMACDDAQCIAADPFKMKLNLTGYLGTEELSESAIEESSGILEPAKWDFSIRQLDENDFELVMAANVDAGWHLYSQYNTKIDGLGPEATEFTFDFPKGVTGSKPVEERGELHDEPEEVFNNMRVKYFSDRVEFVKSIRSDNPEAIIDGSLYFMVCDDKQCLPPETINYTFNLKQGTAGVRGSDLIGSPAVVHIPEIGEPVQDCGEEKEEKKSMLGIFVLGILGGFIALLTPCVFPMIPLTVSFFTKSSGDKKKGIINAATYGFFILAIYVILSSPFHLMDSINPDILNEISTNVWLNVTFFVVFVVFAISFFGYFEITLPSSWANKANSATGVGGLIGIFFMALTLAVVSFSCTGPILGSLLVGSISSDGGAWQLTVGMAGFGLALALPFALFAMFPGWLNSLPQSGGWLNTVKVVLGFAELALAIKFLSNADLVEHWGILKREIFFGFWIVIGIGMVLYLFGKIKFPHDSPIEKLPKSRLAFGFVVLALVIYMIPGLSNTKYANLTLLSGFPPPMFYSLYEKSSDCPLDLQCFKDYEEGMAYAKKVGKPVMLDFTGWACVNCRRMEEKVWVKPEIYKLLNDKFVLISLYVDDRKELPKEQQGVFTTKQNSTRDVITIGNKWSILESEAFGVNSQPYYVLLSPDEQLLNQPKGYTPEVSAYQEFLECGLGAFDELKQRALVTD